MKKLNELKNIKKDELVNMVYNAYVRDWADSNDGDNDNNDCLNDKRIPYIGSFWRDTDFVNKRISIGSAQGYIGVMENNKWGYPERYMTTEEAEKYLDALEKTSAM